MTMPDRDTNYMKTMWGTTSLITDYVSPNQKNPKRTIQEVVYDPANKVSKQEDLYENNEDSEFEYGIEPTYKINPGQKFL